jgi:hypothetical protein
MEFTTWLRIDKVGPPPIRPLTRKFHELLSRDHKDGRATWQPQGVDPEAYLNGTSQGSTPEDARKHGISVVAAGDSWNIRVNYLARLNTRPLFFLAPYWHMACI